MIRTVDKSSPASGLHTDPGTSWASPPWTKEKHMLDAWHLNQISYTICQISQNYARGWREKEWEVGEEAETDCLHLMLISKLVLWSGENWSSILCHKVKNRPATTGHTVRNTKTAFLDFTEQMSIAQGQTESMCNTQTKLLIYVAHVVIAGDLNKAWNAD